MLANFVFFLRLLMAQQQMRFYRKVLKAVLDVLHLYICKTRKSIIGNQRKNIYVFAIKMTFIFYNIEKLRHFHCSEIKKLNSPLQLFVHSKIIYVYIS